MPEEAISDYGLHRTSRERLSILLELEQEYCVWDQAKRELKHLPYLETLSLKENPWPRPLGETTHGILIKKSSRSTDWVDAAITTLNSKNPYRVRSLEARAWAALEVYRYKKWKLTKVTRSRLRTPSSGRTQGLTFALPEHLLRPSDWITSKAYWDSSYETPKRQQVPWMKYLLKYPRRRSSDE